jgi:hypothetical protein
MKQRQPIKVLGATISLVGAALAVILTRPPVVHAQDWGDDGSLIKIGFEIAPVPLNLEGKNRDLVGLGSFIVNAPGECNGCHTAGGPPNFNYANGGNPYFGQPQKIDPSTYLAGGTDFGAAVPPSAGYPPAEYGAYVGPDIITRNLTPDKTGRAEGGHTLAQFKEILRKGTDFDHIHPTCTAALPTPTPANCIPPPVDGDLLQVMPWPAFHSLTDHQIEAVYEYLSAIPCIDNTTSTPPAGAPNELRNDCGGDPQVSSQDSHSAARRRAKPSLTQVNLGTHTFGEAAARGIDVSALMAAK